MIAVLLVSLALVQGVQAHEGASSELFAMAKVILMPYASTPAVTVDGAVSPSEYNSYGVWTDGATQFAAYLTHDNDSLYVALVNPAPGWMALGVSTDLDTGMGFIVVGEVNSTYHVTMRVALNVSDELTFSAADPSTAGTVKDFNITREGSQVTAEFKLAMNSTLWSFEAGELVPTIIAFNRTTASLPAVAVSADVHLLRSYPLRPQDEPAEMQRLFMEDISPVPGIVAVVVMSVGVGAILASFVRRKGVE